MTAGCQDAYLIEHGFHTHGPTRELLSNPAVRQQLAEAEVDAMAVYYGWKPNTEEGDDMIKYLERSENVKLWQLALIDAGFDLAPYGADGSFGPLTRTKTNEFKTAVGLPIDDPATVTLVEWYAMQAYQMGHFDDGVTQDDLDKEIAKTKEALQAVSVLQEEIQGLKVQVNNRQDDLSALANIEQVKKEILARYGLTV
jgi:peptidoglycan hydrolase-like protein with peptidoglycan-binding domain